MARLWGALQSTITEAYKTANDLAQAKWKEITCTVIDEGETTERRLLDVNVMGDILEAFKDANGLVPGMVGYVGPTVQLGDAEGNALIYAPSDPVFQNGVTADGDGTTIDVTGYSKLGIEIIRTDVTTNTISFKSGVTLTNLFDHLASKIGTDGSITPEVEDTATSSVFVHLDVADVKYVQCALSNLAGEGATVTVKGHLE